MTQERDNQNNFASLLRYWPIITSVLLVAVSWGVAITKFQAVENEISSLKVEAKENQQVLTILQVDIREIKTSLEFIKDKVQ